MRILNCLGSWPLSVVLAILAFSSAAVWAELALEHASIRQDRYNIPTEQWQWAEAWGEIRQYFPRYYRPAGTVHVFVQNTGSDPIENISQ